MLTGQRRGDWANASRGEIDIEKRALEIPASRYKTSVPHSVPLGYTAWEIVKGLPLAEKPKDARRKIMKTEVRCCMMVHYDSVSGNFPLEH